jgi:N-acyl-D-aspartate/D-glutamate deacylase
MHRQDEPGGLMIMNHIPEQDMLAAITHPGSIIGSDGMPFIDSEGNMLDWNTPFEQANGHPRGAGTHAKVLRMAREREDLTLMGAIAKMSYLPARFLEDVVPDMKVRGRLRPGAIADITIFDPVTVTDKAGWDKGANSLPSTGIPFVVVNGTVVVKNARVQKDTFPGQAIRNAVRYQPN